MREGVVTPKPWYGADGSKAFGIHGKPEGFPAALERALGVRLFERGREGMAPTPAGEALLEALDPREVMVEHPRARPDDGRERAC